MEYRQFADLKLSRLMIGTVQFGMDYGIADKTGQPSFKDVCDILTSACTMAASPRWTRRAMYGTSEDVIGEALAALHLADKMTIVTKTTHMGDGLDDASADRLLEESIRQSLKRLRLDSLPLVLIHHEEDFRYFESLMKLNSGGLVRHVGSSVMTPVVTKGIVNSGLVEAVQVPTSILDRRYVKAGIFHDCKQRGLGLFVRSMYLQGLILMADAESCAGFGGRCCRFCKACASWRPTRA